MELIYNAKEPTSKKGLSREMFLPWGGYFPHPELDHDIQPRPRYEQLDPQVEIRLKAAAPIPDVCKYHIPDGISLAILASDLVFCSRPSPAVITALEEHTKLPELKRFLTVKGEGRQLGSSKPVDGIYVFIWRSARFISGLDPNIPVTAFWDLEDTVERYTGVGGANAEILALLDRRAGELVESVGGNRYAATQRWQKINGR